MVCGIWYYIFVHRRDPCHQLVELYRYCTAISRISEITSSERRFKKKKKEKKINDETDYEIFVDGQIPCGHETRQYSKINFNSLERN